MKQKQPTDGQKQAGNYPKEHKRVLGMRISVENKAGSERSGKDKGGKEWKVKMAHDYGYIRGTKGKDKDHIDAFLGPHDPSQHPVHVVDQHDPETGAFDEHKVVFGAAHPQEASEVYHANYEPGWRGLGAVTPMGHQDFKKWAFAPGRRTKAVAEMATGKRKFADGGSTGIYLPTPFVPQRPLDMTVQAPGGNASASLPRLEFAPSAPFDASRPAPGGNFYKPAEVAQGRSVGPLAPAAPTYVAPPPAAPGGPGSSGGPVAQANPQIPVPAAAPAAPSTPAAGAGSGTGTFDLHDPAQLTAYLATLGADPSGGDSSGGGSGGYAEGGSVRPYVGYPKFLGHQFNDRDASANIPAYLLRGAVVNTMGAPGDMEKLARLIANLAGAGVDQQSIAPNSEDFDNLFPGKPQMPAERAGQDLGGLFAGVRGARFLPRAGFASGGLAGGLYDSDIGQGALQQAAASSQPRQVVSSGGGGSDGMGALGSYAGAAIGNMIIPGIGGVIGGILGGMF